MPRNFINWSCKLTLYQREQEGGGGQPLVKSEVRAQSSKLARLWFLGVDAREYPGGLLRLDPAFAYVEPPSSWLLPWAEVFTPAPGSNPLQCSCLKNPRDRGAWWAAVYGVTQSQTRLKRLSSSSSSSNHSNQIRQRKKIQIRKEELNLSLKMT